MKLRGCLVLTLLACAAPALAADAVHVEAVDVPAIAVPLFQKINCPAVHAHRAYGQDERDLFFVRLSVENFERDLVAHHRVEIL